MSLSPRRQHREAGPLGKNEHLNQLPPSKRNSHRKPTHNVGISSNPLLSNPLALAAIMLVSAIGVLLTTSWWHRTLALTSPQPSLSRDIVDTGYAQYRGVRAFDNSVAYLGIPYAEPPVGDLRFRRPAPLNTTRIRHVVNGVIDATKYPDFCIQGTLGFGQAPGGAGSEDCLKVNIYAPAGAKKGDKLPVLVYIHGGAYIFGNPRNWPFEHWIQQNPNLVIVSVYYRLSAFGFVAAPGLRNGKYGDLNAGFLDQVEALRWVQKHIASFGGDSERVTINGESAGGSSVELHLVAAATGYGDGKNYKKQLFKQAIAQSVYRIPVPLPEQQEKYFNLFAQHAGCELSTFALKIECLRAASVESLAASQDLVQGTLSGYDAFRPVVDHKVIVDYPTRLVQKGSFVKVPLIIGHTTNETLGGENDIVSALKHFYPLTTEADHSILLEAYPTEAFATAQLRGQTLTGDANFRCATSLLGHAFSQLPGGKVWTYRYDEPIPGAPMAWHASENWMMFRGTNTGPNGTTTFEPQSETYRTFAAELIAYWTSFARSGNPNAFKVKSTPEWHNYSPSGPFRLVLQAANRTTSRGSFVEKEAAEDTRRCKIMAGRVETMQD